MNHSGLELDLRNRRSRPVMYNLDPDYSGGRPERPNAATEEGDHQRRRYKVAVCAVISGGVGLIAAQFIPLYVAAGAAIAIAAVCWSSVEVQ